MKSLAVLLVVCAGISATAQGKGFDSRSTWHGECEKGIKFEAVYDVKSDGESQKSTYLATLTQNGKPLAHEDDQMPMDMATMPNGNTVLNFYLVDNTGSKMYEVAAVTDYPNGDGIVVNGWNPGPESLTLAKCSFTMG